MEDGEHRVPGIEEGLNEFFGGGFGRQGEGSVCVCEVNVIFDAVIGGLFEEWKDIVEFDADVFGYL